MPTNQTNPATEDQKLTSIEKQLLDCAKSKKPVLLFGKYPEVTEDGEGLRDLVLRTYTEVLIEQGIKGINGIVNFELEYFDSKGNPVSIQELKGVYGAIHKDEVLKRIIGQFTNYDSESTVRTRKIIDCTGMNGKEVYAELVELPAIEDKEFGTYKKKEELKTLDDIDYEQQQNKGYLFQCKGLLILDNLQINPGNSEDITYYNKLDKIIRDKDKGIEQITVNWLVAYTYDPEDLPDYFRGQFKEIDLEPKPAIELSVVFDDTTQTVNINNKKYQKSKKSYIPDKEYKLLKLLYENRESRTTKREIQEALEMGASGEQQVFNIVTSLRDILKESGLKIDSEKETKNNVRGGYQIIFENTK